MKPIITLFAIVAVCTILFGCATAPRQKVAVEDLSLQGLEMFVNKHSDDLLASFGPPSRRHPAKHAVYWEYKRDQRLVVFLIRDTDQTVAGVNAGTDETKVYARWASIYKPPAPVIIEAKIIGGGDGSKYYWYEIKTIKVLKNDLKATLDSKIKVAIQNNMSQPEMNKIYTLELGYYNESNPEYGLKVLNLKQK